MATNYPIKMTRGDTLAFNLTLSNVQATVESIFFSCKQIPASGAYAFRKSLGDGINLVSGSTYRVRVAPEDTAQLKPGKYSYDLQLGLGADIYTVLMGTLTIGWDVTENE